jgi:hypothetical protein
MAPVGQENLRLPSDGGRKSRTALCWSGENTGRPSVVGLSPVPLARAFRVHEKQLEIGEAQFVRRKIR